MLFRGAWLYADATKDKKMIQQYGIGTPEDYIEKHLYTKYEFHGVLLLLIVNTLIFNGWGIIIWLIQMLWIPFWAAGVINGLGHWFGYRNADTKDKSRNIIPFGFIIGGEELHNNHHENPASPKLSSRWFEIDIGYKYLKLLEFCRLAKIKQSGQYQQ